MMQVHVVGVSSPGTGLAAEVCFASPNGVAFNVAIPPGQAEAVRRALVGASRQDVLEAWLFSELFDGDLTEVLIEEDADCRGFSLVFSSQGLPMRFSVTPLDAVLTGAAARRAVSGSEASGPRPRSPVLRGSGHGTPAAAPTDWRK